MASRHERMLKSNLPLSFKMDLILYDKASARRLMVLDIKYKGMENPKEVDAQQMMAYAVDAGIDTALLLYPKAWDTNARIRVGHVDVMTGYYDISKDLVESGSALKQYILDPLPDQNTALAI